MRNDAPARDRAGQIAIAQVAHRAPAVPARTTAHLAGHRSAHASASASAPAGGRARPHARRWQAALGLALGMTFAASAVQWSAAQRRDAPRIIVAPTIVAEPASQASLPIQVGPPEALPNNSFVRLRGFPVSVSLTEGHAIAPGAWAIPLFGLATLKAIVPAGVSGRTEIMISLVNVDGSTLAESRTALVIASPPPPERILPDPPARTTVTLPPAALSSVKKTPPAALPDEERARAERLLAQGARHLEQGNIGAARMFFQRAAEAGLAAGALRMGATYDPAELTRQDGAVGINPDRNEARKWYERARDLGALEAEDRLARLR
jgi:hypothetical protein